MAEDAYLFFAVPWLVLGSALLLSSSPYNILVVLNSIFRCLILPKHCMGSLGALRVSVSFLTQLISPDTALCKYSYNASGSRASKCRASKCRAMLYSSTVVVLHCTGGALKHCYCNI